MGKLDILNCGKGHAEITIDGENEIEKERGRRIISDMLRRGYVLFVHGTDGALCRVEKFDPEKFVYIIGAEPEYAPEVPPEEPPPCPSGASAIPSPPKVRRGKYRTKEVPAGEAHVTGIARTAGG